jgi:hypothetical protein
MWRGKLFHACADEATIASAFEGAGLDRREPTSRDGYDAYLKYATAQSRLLLDPDCKTSPSDGTQVRLMIVEDAKGAANVIRTLTAELPPRVLKDGEYGKQVYQRMLQYEHTDAQVRLFLDDGTYESLVRVQKTLMVAKEKYAPSWFRFGG